MTKAMTGKGKAAVKAPPGASVDIEVLQKLQTAIGQPIKVNMIQDALKVIGRRKFDGETDEGDDEDRPTAMQAATDRQATADPDAQRSTSQSATSNLAIKIAQTADDLVAAFKQRTEWNRLLKIFSVNDPAAKVAALRRKINRHLQREANSPRAALDHATVVPQEPATSLAYGIKRTNDGRLFGPSSARKVQRFAQAQLSATRPPAAVQDTLLADVCDQLAAMKTAMEVQQAAMKTAMEAQQADVRQQLGAIKATTQEQTSVIRTIHTSSEFHLGEMAAACTDVLDGIDRNDAHRATRAITILTLGGDHRMMPSYIVLLAQPLLPGSIPAPVNSNHEGPIFVHFVDELTRKVVAADGCYTTRIEMEDLTGQLLRDIIPRAVQPTHGPRNNVPKQLPRQIFHFDPCRVAAVGRDDLSGQLVHKVDKDGPFVSWPDRCRAAAWQQRLRQQKDVAGHHSVVCLRAYFIAESPISYN